MTITQKLKIVAPTALFNILLPIFDIFSDLRLIIILFCTGRTICKNEDYSSCDRDPTSYCTSNTANHDICEETDDGFQCNITWQDDFFICYNDPPNYCTNPFTNHGVCRYESHPLFAVMLLVPFSLNYFMSFITWLRLNNNKKFSFIFALFNLYAPFGKVFIFDL